MAHLDQNPCWRKAPPKPTQNINGKSFDNRKSRVEEIHRMSSSIQPHTLLLQQIPSCLPYGVFYCHSQKPVREITQYSALLPISQHWFSYLRSLLVLSFVYVVKDWIFLFSFYFFRFWALFGEPGFLNQKMKRPSVGFDQSRATDVEFKEKLKYQTLLKEYLELQKEYVSRKRKLQAAKQKRELSLAEVRFLKQKHKHLSKTQAPNADKDLLHLPNMNSQTSTIDQLLLSNSRQ